MKKYRVKKLDARFTGYPTFSHLIEPVNVDRYVFATVYNARVETFLQMREWFWTTFGASREMRFMNPHDPEISQLGWAWDTEHNHMRIYVKEKELNWFLLKWSQ